jgi:hypothetical protein
MKFRTYSLGKITKHGVLERLVCLGESCNVFNVEIYAATSEKCSVRLLVSVCSVVFHVSCVRYAVKDIMP